MALRTGDELKNMIFVYRGQPFVRAAAILSGSADTQSLDYSYTATPFTIPSVFDEAVTPVAAKAIDPGLEYFITSISSSVVSARAPDLFRVADYSPFTVDTTSMSYSWLGRPYVKIPSRREIDTTSLDYALAAEPFVAPAQPDVMLVAKATAPGLQVSRGINLQSTIVAQAASVDPLLAIYTPFIANLGSMSYSWLGQPFVLTASAGTDTPSLDYAYRATPLVVPIPAAAPTILSITIPAPTVTSASAATPQLLPSISLPASSVASATAYDLSLEGSVFISPTTSYAFAYDPLSVHSIDIPPSIVAQSTAHDPALLGSIFIAPTLAQATVHDPVFIQEVFLSSSISPAAAYAPQVGPVITFDLTASLATAIDPLLVYNIVTDTPGVGVATAISASFNLISTLALSSAAVAPSTAHDISFEPSVFLDTAHASAAAHPQDLLLNISLSSTNVAVATAHDVLLQENIEISPQFAPAVAYSPFLLPTIALPVAGTVPARAIDPTIEFQPQEIILGVASATATAPTTSLVQNISIGLGFEVVTSGTLGDAINRGEPFEPWTAAGDLINRGEPFSSNRDVAVTIQYQGVASATAFPPEVEIGAPAENIRLPRLRLGQSGTKRNEREKDREESIVWAKLIRVNDNAPSVKAEGFTRVHNGTTTNFRVLAEGTPTARVRSAWEDIKIAVARVK